MEVIVTECVGKWEKASRVWYAVSVLGRASERRTTRTVLSQLPGRSQILIRTPAFF